MAKKSRRPDPEAIRAATRENLYVYAPRYFSDGKSVINNQSNWHVFPEVDPFSFEVLPKLDSRGRGSGLERYARDHGHVFYAKTLLVGAHAETFELVGRRGYARDRARFYFLGAPVVERRGDERVMGLALVVGANAYLSGKPCPTVGDPASLTMLSEEVGLYRDSARAYFVFEPYRYMSVSHATLQPIDGMDASTCATLGGLFLCDSHSVFAAHDVYHSSGTRGVARLDGLHPLSTRVVREYAIGEHAVYFQTKRVDGVDPSTFRPHETLHYAIDRSRAYYAGEPIVGVDIASFRVFPHSGYAQDAGGLMYLGQRFAADVATFEVLDWNEARDATNVYYAARVLRPATRADCVRKARLKRLAEP